MILAIDAGNSRVKWGVHDGTEWRATGSVVHADIVRLGEAWKPYAPPERIVISNVAGEKIRSGLSVLFTRWRATPHWIQAQKEQCGIQNGYESPSQLGSDRWAAAIGARKLTGRACVAASCGTALTVDALSGAGMFLGGIIVPGLDAMSSVLALKTAGVGKRAGRLQKFPRNTGDAVYSGALQALAGAVERMAAALAVEEGSETVPVVLTGGAAPTIGALLRTPPLLAQHLVLEGLVEIARQ